MFLILSQRIDYSSDYNDVPFEIYHYPKRYRNQIKTGDVFLYYQGDRQKKENRYYFGCGLVGEITVSEDKNHYYAKIINGIRFSNNVPIYNPSGGFYESIGYFEVRQKESPSWQNSIRKVSENAFKTILDAADLDFQLINELLNLDFDDYINKNDEKVISKLTKDLQEKEVEDLLEYATDKEIDKILSSLDTLGSIEVKNSLQKIRRASKKTIITLKELYNYSCQICEDNHNDNYGVNVVEAHHIEYFSETQNHQPNNIVILCPTHHRLVHSAKATFLRDRKVFIYDNGYEEPLKKNKHL